jgi:3-oxoacyl-[acyl-carrier protein] reductase
VSAWRARRDDRPVPQGAARRGVDREGRMTGAVLTGKVALVTGASRGIGRAIALRLAQAGADVVVNHRANRAAALDVARWIEACGRAALVQQADVGDAADVERMIRATGDRFGRLDVLVNNAGIAEASTLATTSIEQWNHVVATNLSGPFYAIRLALPLMRGRGWGRIVNIASLAARLGTVAPDYAASKAGVVMLTRFAARELGPEGITVNAVLPGFVETDMTRADLAFWNTSLEALARQVPVGRIAAPEEVAELVAYLCSDAAGYVTGEAIGITGGR